MKVEFIQRTIVGSTIYEAGATARIDDDIGQDLITRGVARFAGSSSFEQLAWTDITQSAASINPAGAVSAASIDTTDDGWPGTMLFSGSADNLLVGQWQIVHEWAEGTAIKPHIHWMLTADSADAVVWEFYYRISGIGVDAGAWVGPVAGALAVGHNNTANRQAITSFGSIPMTGHTVSVIVVWRLYRRGSTDANSSNARLLSIDSHYQKDAAGSEFEYEK